MILDPHVVDACVSWDFHTASRGNRHSRVSPSARPRVSFRTPCLHLAALRARDTELETSIHQLTEAIAAGGELAGLDATVARKMGRQGETQRPHDGNHGKYARAASREGRLEPVTEP